VRLRYWSYLTVAVTNQAPQLLNCLSNTISCEPIGHRSFNSVPTLHDTRAKPRDSRCRRWIWTKYSSISTASFPSSSTLLEHKTRNSTETHSSIYSFNISIWSFTDIFTGFVTPIGIQIIEYCPMKWLWVRSYAGKHWGRHCTEPSSA